MSRSMAATVEQQVAKSVVPIISVGFADPYSMRMPKIIVGIKVNPDVLIAKRVHMAALAVCLSGFKSCKACIAFRPIGVAAFPNPNKLAETLETIYPIAG